MKVKTHINRIAIIIATALALCSCGEQASENDGTAQDDTVARAPLFTSEETVLNLCPNVVEVPEANNGVKNAYAWILAGTNTLTSFEVTIQKSHLAALQESIVAAHNHTGCAGFVTGLETSLGLSGTELKLLYKPMYLCRKDTTTVFSVTHTSSGYLSYSASGFTNATAAELAWLTNYTSTVVFKESATVTRSFSPLYNLEGDTRAVMLIFQEINAVLNQNQSEILKIWNYAIRLPGNPSSGAVRQSLLLGPEQLTPELLSKGAGAGKILLVGNFAGNYADRSHLCPPGCEEIKLTIAQQGTNDCQQLTR